MKKLLIVAGLLCIGASISASNNLGVHSKVRKGCRNFSGKNATIAAINAAAIHSSEVEFAGVKEDTSRGGRGLKADKSKK